MPMEAIEVWRRQLEDNERHELAFSELERLLNRTESFDELAALYEEWIAGTEQVSDTISVKSRLATLTINILNDGLGFVDHIREIFDIDPLHQASIESLSVLFADEERCQLTGADQNAIAELLEPIARGLTIEAIIESEHQSVDEDKVQTEELSEVSEVPNLVSTRTLEPNPKLLVQVLDVLQQNEMDPDVRANQLLELAELQEQVENDLSAAFDARLIALRFSATELDNRHALQRLALSTHRYQDLASGLEQAANEALEIEDKSSLLLELGKVYESYLDDFEKAGFFYQEILNDAPQHQGAVTALETLYARLSQYQDLVDLYLRLADESEDDEGRIRRLFQACEMMRHLDAHDQLIETYRSVLEIDDQNLVAYRELERLFQITEEWGALASLLQERIERFEAGSVSEDSDDPAEQETIERFAHEASVAFMNQKAESRAELRSRLAKLLEQLNDYDEAIETWRTVLEEDDSQFEPAFEALDQMASAWRSLGVDEPRRQTVSEILSPLYFEQGQWEAWIRTTEDRLDFIFDPEERTEHFKSIAEIVEKELNDLTRALDYYALAFQALPDQNDLEAEVDRLIESTELWSRAIEIFEAVVAQVFDPEEGTRLWLKVAKLYESKLVDDERAQSAYLKARELSPDSETAINELRSFYTSRELHRSLVDLLKDVAVLLDDESARVEALSHAGQLLTQTLDQAEEAIEVYSLLRQEAPDAIAPLLELEKLHRQAENWSAVIDCLNEQVELEEDETLKVNHLHAMAKVYGESLQNIDEQIVTLRQVLDLQATEIQSLSLLKSLFTQREDWNDLSLLLEDERSHYEDESLEGILLDVQLAHLNREHTLQAFTAVELYGAVLDRRMVLESSDQATVVAEVVNGLSELIQSHEVSSDAADLLITYFDQSQQFEELKSVYETLISAETDPLERSNLYTHLGHLLRDKLQVPKDAFFAFVQALRDDLQNEEILTTLQVIGGEQSMYSEMVQAYAEIAALDPHSDLGATLSRLRAKLCENRLQDIAQATEAWENSLNVDPEHQETLKALSGLYDKQERWSDLVAVLETRVELEPEDYELRVLLGELIVRVYGDARRAIEQWKVVLMDFPNAESAQRMLENYLSDPEFVNDISLVLEPIYEEQEQWESWIRLDHALLEASSDDDEVRREELWTELGQLYAERLADETQALHAYSEAFLINPVEPEIREKLFALVEQQEAWLAFLPKLIQGTRVVSDPELLVSDYLKIAAWSEQFLDDSDQAVDAYQNALRVEGECFVAIQALERIFTQRSDWGSLAEVQQRQLEATYDEEKRIELLKNYAQNVWHNLGQVDRAQDIYEELITINDQDQSSYQALEQLLKDMDKPSELLNLLERKLDAVNLSSVEQLNIQKQFISIAEMSGDQYRAAEIARQAYEDHQDDPELKSSLQRLLLTQENWDDLKELLDQDLETAQGQEQARLAQELAVLCEDKLSLIDDAIDYLLKAIEVNPDDRVTFEKAHRLMSQVMRYDDLLDLVENYLKSNRDLSNDERVNLNIDLAHRAQEEGMQDRAVEALERVLAIDSNHPLALSALAKAYEEDGDWSKATDMLQRALEYSESGQAKADALTRLGVIYMDQLDDDAQAKQIFESAIKEAPTTQALDALVMFARDEENEVRVGALLELKLPITEGRERVSVYRELANYYHRSNRSQDQLVILEKAYQEAPEATKLTEMLVERYLEDQRFNEAEPMIRKMMESLKLAGNSKALNRYNYQLGKLKQAQGDQDAALALFEQCKATDPTFAPALVALSQIYVNASRWDDAQALLSPLLIQRKLSVSDKVEVFYLNGLTRQALGDTRKAKDMFQRALSLNSDHELSREGLNSLV
ncbi:MAG: hypothetical protein CMH49_05780 [Myxococcales bacterium]|nr:hypothetical protein [Myxococcales bacterium]